MAIASFCDHCGAENALGETICHACQHPLAQPFTSEATNSLLNERYAIMHEIGAGGFGAVYLARDTRERERLVAVKQINLQGLSSQEIIEATDAFNREAEILSTLSHPLLPTIFDRFSDPKHWYLVMTYIDGSTLDEYLQQQRVKALPASAGLPLSETLEIALRLSDGLHYLHAQQPPVIFRDLKPGNIMRTRKGQLYLIDFGIARRFKPGQAKDTIPFGSPGFAAPEQYGRAQTTPQADIYSLGALLYCLITGDDPSEHPFAFPPLHQYGKDGISEINTLIQSMVTPDPIQRPADIREVQIELQRIQQLNIRANQQGRIWIPPQSQTPPANSSGQQHIFLNQANAPQKPRKTTRRTVLITSLVLGGVAAVGGLAALSNQSQPQPQPITQTDPNQNASLPINGPTYWSPDMSYVATPMQNQIEIYRVQNQQRIQSIQIPTNFSALSLYWSSDNNTLLALTISGILYAWEIAKGTLLFATSSLMPGNNPADSVAYAFITNSPNGQIWSMSYNDNKSNTYFILFQANNGKMLFPKSIANPSQATPSNIAWSPDSQYFAFPDAATWPGGSSCSIGIWERGTHQRVNSITVAAPADASGTYSIRSIAWSLNGQKLAAIVYDTIYIIQIGGQRVVSALNTKLGTEDAINSFIWSPDGQYIAALIQQNLSVWSTSVTSVNGQQISLNGNGYPPQTNNIVAFSWSTDSQSLLVADDQNNLWTWAIDNY